MKFLRSFFMMLLTVSLGTAIVGCSKDNKDDSIIQEPDSSATGLYGTWIENGVGFTNTLTFNKDGSGQMRLTVTTSDGHSQTTTFSFSYTYSETSGILLLYITGTDTVLYCPVQLTGDTMMITIDGLVYVLKRA